MVKMTRINAKIRQEDRQFLRDFGIGITELINSAIYQRKQELFHGTVKYEQLQKNCETISLKLKKILIYLEKEGLLDNYYKYNGYD
jgi:hypothetical protein